MCKLDTFDEVRTNVSHLNPKPSLNVDVYSNVQLCNMVEPSKALHGADLARVVILAPVHDFARILADFLFSKSERLCLLLHQA